MKLCFLLFVQLLVACLGLSDSGFSTTCTKERTIRVGPIKHRIPGDWVEGICKYAAVAGNRCATDPIANGNILARCSSATQGCSGCVGTVAPGHWIVTSFTDGTTKRCKCGCFAQETEFELLGEQKSGTEMIESPYADSIVARGDGSFGLITEVVWGPETPLAFKLSTRSGHEITLSHNHPVVVFDPVENVPVILKAEDLKVGSLLVERSGAKTAISNISRFKYQGQMMNFFILGDHSIFGHLITANGLRMGDNGLQQMMARSEKRVLARKDILNLLTTQNVEETN